MHMSGSSASCAQPQIADIGFRGETVKVDDNSEASETPRADGDSEERTSSGRASG